jgi:hypothetical protein
MVHSFRRPPIYIWRLTLNGVIGRILSYAPILTVQSMASFQAGTLYPPIPNSQLKADHEAHAGWCLALFLPWGGCAVIQ